MGPPPPPSPSYNFVFDTDSEDDDENPDHSPSPVSPRFVVEDPEKTDEAEGEPQETKKKSKRKKKRKKKKNKPQSEVTERKVRFSNVSVREFERCLGTDVVPVDGGWPLGISNEVRDEYEAAESIEVFEERRQEELRKRWLEIMSQYMKDKKDDSLEMPLLTLPPQGVDLETRQFDYRRKVNEITGSRKNPLFGPLSEEARMRLLVSESSGGDSPAPPPTKSPTGKKGRRTRSNSEQFSSHDVPKSPSRTQRRTRSNSDQFSNRDSPSLHKSPGGKQRRLRSDSFNEQLYNETYTSLDVLHVRNELEQIRVHRSMEGNAGCGCRKLDVYLPPPGGGGKKAQHRRMNERKVREELKKRGLLPPKDQKLSRAELEQRLHDAVEKEPCCWGDDCFCARNGLSCQADACSCWYDSHQRKGHTHTVSEEDLSDEAIRERCGNNMYVVDTNKIKAFRKQFCQEVTTTTGE